MLKAPEISVIISTYNSPRWLELVLRGYFLQKCNRYFEIIVADDGSRSETAELVERLAQSSPVPIRHVWQPDEGFQKCRILNKAIASSQARLLLFTDGDCVPQPNMVAVHISRAHRGAFLTGGYLKLPELLSHRLTPEDLESGRAFWVPWLIQQGYRPSLKLLKLMMPSPWDRLANRLTPTKRTWNGHNASCFREDAEAVNGFNELIQYGGQDVEFGSRLNHSGVRGRHLRFSTIPLHLHHGHGYVTPGMRERSAIQRAQTLEQRTVRTAVGLDQWMNHCAKDSSAPTLTGSDLP